MNRVQTVFRMFMLVAIVGLTGGAVPVAAQSLDRSDDTWVSELTGVEITFSSDWELADERVSPDGESELIFLETRDGFLMIGFGSTDDVENTIASTIGDIDGAEQVDGAVEPDFAWGLAQVADPDSDVQHVYVEAENAYVDDFQLVAGLFGGDDFVDLFDLVQESVSVDGGYVFVEHDADDLEAMIGEAPVADDEATPADDENVSETGGSGRDSAGSEEPETYAYESADLEVEVSSPVSISDVQIEEGTYEQVLLVGNGGIGTVSVLSNEVSPRNTLNGFMTGFTGEMEEAEEIDSGVEGDVAWTMYTVSFDGSDMYVYAFADGSQFPDMHMLQLFMAPQRMFEDQFVTFQESVLVNGEGMFTGIDVADLIELAE